MKQKRGSGKMVLNELIARAAAMPQQTIAIAAAADIEVLEAVALAVEGKLASFMLFGDQTAIETLLKKDHPQLLKSAHVSIKHSSSPEACAVAAVRSGEASVLMKGNIATSTLLKAVLHRELGLRGTRILSHVACFEAAGFNRLLFVSDAALNITPDLQEKVQIVQNAVIIARAVGVNNPKVAPIAAVEVVNPAMQATIDAAALTQMNRRGQIQDCVIDGPLALDNAISITAMKQKGITSEVAGKADILLVPNIEVGNILYKSLIYFGKAKVGAVVVGAKAPIVLTSRADSAQNKLYSIALAILSTTFQ